MRAYLTGCFLVLFLIAMCSCSRVQYVPIEKEHISVIRDTMYVRDSVSQTNQSSQRDSIIRKDSIVYVVDESGKILRKELYSQKEIYSNLEREYRDLQDRYERLKTEKADTVYQDRPVYIEKQLSRWKQLQLDIGGWAMGGFIVMIIFLIFYIYTKSAGADKK